VSERDRAGLGEERMHAPQCRGSRYWGGGFQSIMRGVLLLEERHGWTEERSTSIEISPPEAGVLSVDLPSVSRIVPAALAASARFFGG
jgi:hypothetical protein